MRMVAESKVYNIVAQNQMYVTPTEVEQGQEVEARNPSVYQQPRQTYGSSIYYPTGDEPKELDPV